MEIERLGPDHVDRVLAAAHLFDETPRREWTERFLAEPRHHLLVASIDGVDVGFVTGVEMVHPDKGTEMFVYELGVEEAYRRRGVGRALTDALVDLARQAGCYGVWVGTEPDNAAALATYRAAGFEQPGESVTLDLTF